MQDQCFARSFQLPNSDNVSNSRCAIAIRPNVSLMQAIKDYAEALNANDSRIQLPDFSTIDEIPNRTSPISRDDKGLNKATYPAHTICLSDERLTEACPHRLSTCGNAVALRHTFEVSTN
jgi:hypothetical protein